MVIYANNQTSSVPPLGGALYPSFFVDNIKPDDDGNVALQAPYVQNINASMWTVKPIAINYEFECIYFHASNSSTTITIDLTNLYKQEVKDYYVFRLIGSVQTGTLTMSFAQGGYNLWNLDGTYGPPKPITFQKLVYFDFMKLPASDPIIKQSISFG